jgi:hypothetical protein
MSQALSPFVVDRGSINGHDNYQGSRDLSQQQQQQQQLTAPLMLMMQVLQEMLKLMQCMREEVMLRLPKKRILEEEEEEELEDELKERKKKKKKPKLMKKVEGDVQCRVFNYELVLISTFLMTRVGLESVCMLEFNKTWAVAVNLTVLSKKLAELMKKNGMLSHVERRQMNKNGTKPLRTFSKASLKDVLKRQMTPLGLFNYNTTVKQLWPEIKTSDLLLFDGEEWVDRWRQLLISNPQDVKHWKNEFSSWECNVEVDQVSQCQGWIACRRVIPDGLFHIRDAAAAAEEEEEEEEREEEGHHVNVEFGWRVIPMV